MRRHHINKANSSSIISTYEEWLVNIGCKLYVPGRTSYSYDFNESNNEQLFYDVINNVKGTFGASMVYEGYLFVSDGDGIMFDMTGVPDFYGGILHGDYLRDGAWTTIISINWNGRGYNAGNNYRNIVSFGQQSSFYLTNMQLCNNGNPPQNEWVHATYLHQSPNVGNAVTIYNNNSMVFTQVTTSNATQYDENIHRKVVALGTSYAGSYYHGYIHDFYMFNRVLTEDEITTIYEHDRDFN